MHREPRTVVADERAHEDLAPIPASGEEEHRRLAARYRAIVESTTTMTVSTAADGSFVARQERWAAYTGQSFEEMRGFGWLTALHPDERKANQELFALAMRERKWFESKVRVFHAATGEHRWCVLRAAPVVGESGAIEEWFGIGVDIHPQRLAELERDRLERELRANEERFRTLAEALPQIVWTSGPDGAVEYFNQRWSEYTGRSARESLGWAWQETVEPSARQRMVAAYRRAVTTEKELETHLRLRAADGSHRWHLIRALPVRDAEGRVIRWFGTCTDVDQSRRLVEALEEASRQKNQFLAMLAHELRNPLAPIRNATEVLRVGAAVPETIEWARAVVDRQVRHLSRLVDDLLDVSRISEGKIILRREPIELLSAVAAAIEMVRPALDGRKQELRVALPHETVRLDADPTRLAQVIANLLDNASKFSESGAAIDLEAELRTGEIAIRVRDRGVGIAPEMLSAIFGLFVQADRSLARSQGGLGIGLTLVRSLVELHGGRVEAVSNGLGRGSEFIVRLPTLGESRAAPSPLVESEPQAAARRVLVVDDSIDAAQSLATVLELGGHVVQVAFDGTEALEVLERFAPEVALVDIGLPGMDGFELGARLRARLGRSVLLIAVTGYGRAEDRERSKAAGFDLHFLKPLDLAKLTELLETRTPGKPGS